MNRRGTIVISSNPESRFLPLETIEFRGTGTATESLRVGFSIEMGSSNSREQVRGLSVSNPLLFPVDHFTISRIRLEKERIETYSVLEIYRCLKTFYVLLKLFQMRTE